ncbi:hypothetical protein EVAR_85963_1 [Eumeta japonica]|uniref:Uncharacterized protein n=1 Tax=Eumeta variegata TaxID=151549 RepID=A0A4C1UJ06_EUMVA|nr:hypothetical protein EVAR_85963_1 [Eumeta japonica]
MDRGYTVYPGKLLHKLSESEQATPRVISIDSMSVGYEKGNVEDYLGSIAASEKNTRSRNERLERLRKQTKLKRRQNREAKELAREQTPETAKASVRQQRTRKPRHLKDNERFTKVSLKPKRPEERSNPVVMPVEIRTT